MNSTGMHIEKLRAETPGTNHVIHFNNAGASLMPKSVSETVVSYLRNESLYGGYETAQKYSTELNDIYSSISTFINAQSPKEIAILENATAAWNMAFHAIDFEDGDCILTSKAEYASNYISYLRLQQKSDITIDVIPNDEFGQTSVESLQNMIDDNVKLISITHIPTNSGLVNPVEEIGTIANEYNCLYLVDACQSVGHYPVDVQQIGCDMLSATGRKYLRGPRGTGFLYVNKDQISDLIPPFLDLHSAEWTAQNRFEIRDDAQRFENWERNYAGILGLKRAVEYANECGIEQIWNRITDLAEKFRWQLAELPSVNVHDIGETKCGIVTFAVEEVEAEHVKAQLADQNVNVSISTRSSTLLDMQERELDEVIRASVHYYNTSKEIEEVVAAVKAI